MTFASPWLLLSLLAVPAAVVWYRESLRKRARRVAELAAEGLVTTARTEQLGARRHVPFGLLVVALGLVGVALARPHVTLTLPERQGTVILAFDVSNSMLAKDLEPTRIEAAKVAARAFVERQPRTIRIGVVAFGDSPVTALRPTTVQKDVLAAIDRLSVSGGTSVAGGLLESLRAIAGKPIVVDEAALESDAGSLDIGFYGSSAVVLLSDGENTSEPDPLDLARIASTAGVHVHTIGLGTPEGTVVEVDGFTVATALDRELLSEIADVTDGTYHEAADAAALARVYDAIDLELEGVRKDREVTAFFAAGAGLLLLASSVLSIQWLGRVI